MALHIYRVLVRGRLTPVDDHARARLLAECEAHAVSRAGFSESGTLTYDRSLTSFGFRQQVRVHVDGVGTPGPDDDTAAAEAQAAASAEAAAAQALEAIGATGCDLRTSATDMAAVWRREGGGHPRP
jgi:hypothetical protein